MKFVHAADNPQRFAAPGPLRRYEGRDCAPMRLAVSEEFQQLVDYCLRERARLLPLSGDTFDSGIRDWRAAAFFAGKIGDLVRHGCQVAMVPGNHDAPDKLRGSFACPRPGPASSRWNRRKRCSWKIRA